MTRIWKSPTLNRPEGGPDVEEGRGVGEEGDEGEGEGEESGEEEEDRSITVA